MHGNVSGAEVRCHIGEVYDEQIMNDSLVRTWVQNFNGWINVSTTISDHFLRRFCIHPIAKSCEIILRYGDTKYGISL